jgi:hypothetical protein
MRRLLTVEDHFLIARRGLIVVPAPAIEDVRGPGDVHVELRRPDGSCATSTLTLAHEFLFPPPAVRRWNCMFKSLNKTEVPIGTEVWCAEEVFLVAHPGNEEAG